jgi:hypothetical protein
MQVSELARFLISSIAIGGTSMILGRSRLFRAPRWWIHRHLGEFAWDFCKCPWCISTWLALPVAIYVPLVLTASSIVNTLITWMAMVAIAPLAGGIIYLCYGFLPPVPTEAEWYSDAELLKTNNLDDMVDAFSGLPKEHRTPHRAGYYGA